MNTWKDNLEESKKHYVDWWQRSGLVLNMWEHFQTGVKPHADVAPPAPPRDLRQKWFDPQWRADYLDWYVAHSCLKADILPVANTQLGPGSLAAILGARLEGGEDTIWIHGRGNEAKDALTFSIDNDNYQLHKDLLRRCKQKAEGHYYVGMPDLMEGLDVLAALNGTDQVLLDTVMHPERVEQQLQAINDIYFQVFDELYDIIREGDEMAFCYFSSWAPGKMSKLQCDLSTMISEDDYRRFVLPFIRQQCQRIDYTLYHLDGVGAIRHLPALLEIDQLDAIQWTPGVGEPQGGSEKWYDLYRRILDGGKSVMCSWVKVEELRPLLNAIGTQGVHLEMDFHNEEEVEEALRIVNSFTRQSIAPTPSADRRDIERNDSLLVLDGAMGTMIQQYHLREEDYRGARFANHPKALKGCNDLLPLTAPFIVRDIHCRYLEAGADMIETDTFNAQRISMADYGLADHCRDINLAAARLARECADAFSTPDHPRYVAGSIGPTSRTLFGDPSLKDSLRQAYSEQIQALADGGVDALLIETIFDVENARVAIEAARATAPHLPLMLSFSVSTAEGHNMLGQNVLNFLDEVIVKEKVKVFSVGINCLTDVAKMTPLVKELSRFGCRVSLYPNAGMPDDQGRYTKKPEQLLHDVWPLLEGHHLNIIGGCCGTTDNYIRLVAKAVEPVPGVRISPLACGVSATERRGLTRRIGGLSDSEEREEKRSLPFEDGAVQRSSVATLFDAIVAGQADEAVGATRKALADGKQAQALIDSEMIPAMGEVGRRFEQGEAFVPQLLMAGRAMKAAMEVVKPLMAEGCTHSAGKVVIGTVKGDLHDIGKNLVASMLEGNGFEVVDIGIDIDADTFVRAVRQHQPDILCLSALLTTTMDYMKVVIDALEAAGLRQKVKVMVGGAPVSQAFAYKIGADAYGDNANAAVAIARQLV